MGKSNCNKWDLYAFGNVSSSADKMRRDVKEYCKRYFNIRVAASIIQSLILKIKERISLSSIVIDTLWLLSPPPPLEEESTAHKCWLQRQCSFSYNPLQIYQTGHSLKWYHLTWAFLISCKLLEALQDSNLREVSINHRSNCFYATSALQLNLETWYFCVLMGAAMGKYAGSFSWEECKKTLHRNGTITHSADWHTKTIYYYTRTT